MLERARVARPTRHALLWLIGLGAFFYASYGFTNWLAGLRTGVPSIVFDWEREIPFIGWTIFPYWTTNLFYAASLLLCRTPEELGTHARRLLTAQLVAIACFALFPLKFSWPKPEVVGFFGFFYEALGAFDKPFNQAPSLHVALTVILSAFYFRLLPKALRLVFAAWSALVAVSVLTTYQHHFIDIPLGFLLGLVCLWVWPFDAEPPLQVWHLTGDPQRRRLALFYASGALGCVGAAFLGGGAWLWLLWPALSLGLVSLAYLGFGPALFAKRDYGHIDWPARLMLAPYLAGAFINSRLWTFREAKTVGIAGGVYLGRFPTAGDAARFGSVVDLTGEFLRPDFAGEWRSVPMLDLVSPDPRQLRAAASAITAATWHGPVLVVCALGYGRSVAALACWLVRSGRAESVEAALEVIRQKRPRLAIRADQQAAIREACDAASA